MRCFYMSKHDYPYSTINDAVHGVMSFPKNSKEQLLKKIIDSDTFQRLRHIKQMGMADLVFPTATHSRFSHSLGAAYVAYRMCESLRGLVDDKYSKKYDDIEKYAVIGALLHDIGHGPFSHAFEALLEPQKNGALAIKHEDWTRLFLQKFRSILDTNGIDIDRLSSFISKKNTEHLKEDDPLNLAADIVSSQLDADRLDYLLRDSHFCGVPYGNVDIEWIIKHLVIIENTGYPPRLGIDHKGTRAVEHFLLGRKLLYQNVSYHYKIRILEKLLFYFLKSCCEALDKEKFITNKKLRTFFSNVEKYTSELGSKEMFINNNFDYYSSLTDNDIWTLIRDLSEVTDDDSNIAASIAKVIYTRKLHHNLHFSNNVSGAVEKIIEDIRKKLELNEWELFVVNKSVMQYESNKDPILVDNKGIVSRIQQHSDLLKLMSDKEEWTNGIAISVELWSDEKKKDYINKQLNDYIL